MTIKDLENAAIIINSIKGELALGTKHYDSRTPDVIVTDVESIIALMIADFLTAEPVPERKREFDELVRTQVE